MKPIPVYINNFNRLTPVRQMIQDLHRMGVGEYVRIIDNASTYPPLLDWYAAHCPVEVIRLKSNMGPRAPWAASVMPSQPHGSFYVCCDSDLDLSECPDDLFYILAAGLVTHADVCKVGPGIEVNDIPDASPFAQRIREVEGKYWNEEHRRDANFFVAPIDTAFAMYRWGMPACVYGPALRADRPYVVRHLPYYLTEDTMTAEELYYIRSVPQSHKAGLYWTTLFQDKLQEDEK